MPETAHSTSTSSKPITQFSLTAMIQTIPEAMAYLRGGLYRLPKAVAPEDTSETKSTNSPGPKLPFNVDVVDAADLQLEHLSYWAEYCGADMSNLGNVWRYHRDHPTLAGEIRGVLYDDPRPADRLATRLLAIMRSKDWNEPEGMHANLHALLARHATTWPAIHDLLLQARAK